MAAVLILNGRYSITTLLELALKELPEKHPKPKEILGLDNTVQGYVLSKANRDQWAPLLDPKGELFQQLVTERRCSPDVLLAIMGISKALGYRDKE